MIGMAQERHGTNLLLPSQPRVYIIPIDFQDHYIVDLVFVVQNP